MIAKKIGILPIFCVSARIKKAAYNYAARKSVRIPIIVSLLIKRKEKVKSKIHNTGTQSSQVQRLQVNQSHNAVW